MLMCYDTGLLVFTRKTKMKDLLRKIILLVVNENSRKNHKGPTHECMMYPKDLLLP
jgi:hypothetical protein